MRIPLRIKMRFTYRFYRETSSPGFALTVLFGFVGFTWLYRYRDWMFWDASLSVPPFSLYSGFYLLGIPIKLLPGNCLPCRGFRWITK